MDGLLIARERIAREAEEKTGSLDLGNLGLKELPDELFKLKQLRRLNLGCGYLDKDGEFTPRLTKPNAIAAKIHRLVELGALQHLWLSATDLSDLAPLQGLADLQSLDLRHTEVSDLTSLQVLTNLQVLICSTPVSELAPLQSLTNLQSLICRETQVSDLAPLQSLTNLQSLDCSWTQAGDFAPLKSLTKLRLLNCAGTLVSDLAPLKGLTKLQSLNCTSTLVRDLAPLWGLTNLRSLNCLGTQVRDLAPLQGLTNLQSLDCSQTQVNDLAPLRSLINLQSLDFLGTQVTDLGPLQGLINLQSLKCQRMQVRDLTPLQRLTNLQSLDCSYTQVTDLTSLQGLTNLQSLNSAGTLVSDLAPLEGLTNLQSLNCSGCRLTSVPEGFWFKRSLVTLHLFGTHLPGIPAEVLSNWQRENCLDSLRAHVRDLDAGREVISDIKLMVLGNGRVGKTQICMRLRGEDYDPNVESTHGILVTSAPLPGSRDSRERLQIWDFGGQDIYHGTHALFKRCRAVFPLVWIKEAETRAEYSHGGTLFRNQPLAYWLDYVRNFGGADSPVLIIQTRCDRPDDEILSPPVPEAVTAFPFKKIVHYSAKYDRGRGALDEALHQAAVWLRERQGTAEIGAGRFRVKQKLETMRDEDAARPPADRQTRTIAQDDFRRLCEEAGGVSSPDHLLSFLHDTGVVFYREGLFADRIIIDQSWALESIYAIFHREKCLKKLQRQKRRFTLSDLGEWVWNAAGHSIEDQKLFLSMMQSCGICFAHRHAQPDKKIETEYIAPDYLPEKSEIAFDLALKWDVDLPTESVEFDYSLLHPGLMRAIISRIGLGAGLNADYWRGGLFAYEAGTGSRALIEEVQLEGWQGRICLKTQRGQAAQLVARLTALIEEEHRRMGVRPATRKMLLTPGRISVKPRSTAAESESKVPLKFTQEPAAKPEYFVSYAWKDDTPEGKERELIVDRLCAAAEECGMTIVRDKNMLGLGDRISKFMRRVGRGNRVFVVLSNKYLKSPYCMYELYELWRNCRQDDEEFLSHVRVYTLTRYKDMDAA